MKSRRAIIYSASVLGGQVAGVVRTLLIARLIGLENQGLAQTRSLAWLTPAPYHWQWSGWQQLGIENYYTRVIQPPQRAQGMGTPVNHHVGARRPDTVGRRCLAPPAPTRLEPEW